MIIGWLSDDYFLHFVVQFEDVNPGSRVNGLADTAIDGLAAEDAPRHVNYLQGGFAFVDDHPIAIAIESKGP